MAKFKVKGPCSFQATTLYYLGPEGVIFDP